MSKKVNIGQKAKVNIKWNVRPLDYSHETESEIISKFAKKYGIPKENVKVEPVFITKSVNGDNVPLTDGMLGNVQDPKFHQELFKRYIEEKEINDVDFDAIVEIDNSINSEIDYESYDKRKKYTVKWIKWSNFMSYGENNFVDMQKLDGLVLLTSEPANQGGKTTFCLDLLRFLLFGKVTSRESDWTLAKVFNKHLPEATDVIVEGCIELDGEDYVIKRVVTRPALKKRTNKSKVSQKLSYYKLVNDQYIDLEDEENMEGDNSRETNKAIKEAIGNERDFDLMICVDSDNLKSLISLKDTDRGRLISRWIGLLPLEEKDKLAREKFNTVVMKSLLTNRYNKDEILTRVETLTQDNKDYAEAIVEFEKKQKEGEAKLKGFVETKDTLLQSKMRIDETLSKVDVHTVKVQIDAIIEEGKKKRAELELNKKKLKEYGNLTFNESEYTNMESYCQKLNIRLTQAREQAKALKNEINTLKKGEYCPTCGAKLKDVDNTKAISDKQKQLDTLINNGVVLSKEVEAKTNEKEALAKKRSEYNDKIRVELIVAKLEVDIENLTAQYKEKKRILKDVETNKSAIENNNKIENSLNIVNENIKAETNYVNGMKEQITANNTQIKANEKTIKECNDIIAVLIKEEKLIRNWKIYLEMVGKHGISKIVLRSVLPFINGELKHMLNDVCDFDVEVSIDDRNDVAFYLIHNDVQSNLASGSGFEQTVASLALRSVLSKISTFSKPSFVVFDEILGGVADENYEQVKLLYDKIAKDYKCILQISHLKALFEWHKHFIKIKKKNDISVIGVE